MPDVSRAETLRVAQEMSASCLNMRVRALSRVITGIFDAELRDYEITGGQLNLLAAIAIAGPVRRTNLGRAMHLDSSTLTRNLRIMETNGWIEDSPDGVDGRGRPVRLTSAGGRVLETATPAWRTAQRRAARLVGSSGKTALLQLAGEMVDATSIRSTSGEHAKQRGDTRS